MENTKRRKLQKQDRRFEQDKPELLLRTSCYCHHYYFRSGAGYLLVLILVTLLVNCALCFMGMADGHVLSERLGAVFYTGCGALIRNWFGKPQKNV
jgi:hypothetical protein